MRARGKSDGIPPSSGCFVGGFPRRHLCGGAAGVFDLVETSTAAMGMPAYPGQDLNHLGFQGITIRSIPTTIH